MRRPLNADPCFFGILDAEARIIGCSGNALVRCGTLDLIARNNQARIPGMFKEEREIAIYCDALQKAHELFAGSYDDHILCDLIKTSPEKLNQAVLDAVYLLLETERKIVFHRRKQQLESKLKP